VPEKDIVSKHLLKRIALDLAIYLFKLDIDDADLLETEFQRVEDRRADLLLHVKAPKEYLLHIEVQNDNHPNMLLRMLRYHVDIALAHPDKLIYQYVIYIGSKKLQMQNVLEAINLSYRYELIDMRTIDCNTFLQQDNPDALVLAILCDFKGKDPHQVVRYILQRLKDLLQDNVQVFREYWSMLDVLSGNRALQSVLREETEMLSATKMSDLASYQGGFLDGRAEGRVEGRVEGLLEGRHEGLAHILLLQLKTKFEEIPEPIHQQIQQANDEQLMQWANKILSANSLDEIFTH